MKKIIKVTNKEKITTLRLSEATKKELESFGSASETREEILKRLLKLIKYVLGSSDTEVIKHKNIIGTKYGKLSRTFNIETDEDKHAIVCIFNDVSLMNLMALNKGLQKHDWELELDIINLSTNSKKYNGKNKMVTWKKPNIFAKENPKEYLLLYLIAVKQVLEEMFSIKIHEMTTADDYFNIEKWKDIYVRNNFSTESFYNDVQKKIK